MRVLPHQLPDAAAATAGGDKEFQHVRQPEMVPVGHKPHELEHFGQYDRIRIERLNDVFEFVLRILGRLFDPHDIPFHRTFAERDGHAAPRRNVVPFAPVLENAVHFRIAYVYDNLGYHAVTARPAYLK